jgi:acyl-CoA dehydrogenase
LHSEIVAPYLLHYGTDAQKTKYLPKLASGEMVGAIAMTEPAAGSDLQGIKSTAIQQADGSFVLNGSKTYITNGWHSDLVIVVAKTNPSAGAKGTSLLLVEQGMAGARNGEQAFTERMGVAEDLFTRVQGRTCEDDPIGGGCTQPLQQL